MKDIFKVFLVENMGIDDSTATKLDEQLSVKLEEEVQTRVSEIKEKYEDKLEEQADKYELQIASIEESFDEQSNEIFTEAINEWALENKAALDSQIKVNIAENLVQSIIGTLHENHIHFNDEEFSPELMVNEDLVVENADLKAELNSYRISEQIDQLVETHGLDEQLKSKLFLMCENVETDKLNEYIEDSCKSLMEECGKDRMKAMSDFGVKMYEMEKRMKDGKMSDKDMKEMKDMMKEMKGMMKEMGYKKKMNESTELNEMGGSTDTSMYADMVRKMYGMEDLKRGIAKKYNMDDEMIGEMIGDMMGKMHEMGYIKEDINEECDYKMKMKEMKKMMDEMDMNDPKSMKALDDIYNKMNKAAKDMGDGGKQSMNEKDMDDKDMDDKKDDKKMDEKKMDSESDEMKDDKEMDDKMEKKDKKKMNESVETVEPTGTAAYVANW